ncbi:MAG: YlmC/YmxH family sporulation protein [Firmicutes bacterium]|nr:YlmC/YmxH family sporulation protein [Bacillota bacterium]
MVRVSELKNRDVVNVNDGKRLGFITDLVLDISRGSIQAIVIPQAGRFWFFGGKQEHIISWDKIVRVGVDIILVDCPLDYLR